MKRLTFCLLAVFALAGLALADTNVTGRWTGTFAMIGPNGETNDGEALLVLKQTGSDISGTVGPNEGEQHQITKGTIEGDKITLESADGAIVIHFALVVKEDRITGDAHAERDGRKMQAKLDVKKQK